MTIYADIACRCQLHLVPGAMSVPLEVDVEEVSSFFFFAESVIISEI